MIKMKLHFPLALLVSSRAWAACPPPFDAFNRDPSGTASESALLASISALSSHVNATTYDPIQIDADRTQFTANAARLTSSLTTIEAALDLVDKFESIKGPLFVSPSTVGGLVRAFLPAEDDGMELERAILTVQQSIFDEIYHGSIWHPTHRSDPMDRPSTPIIEDCAAELSGRKWLTSLHFPGDAPPPADPSFVHTIQVNATFGQRWGRRVAFADNLQYVGAPVHDFVPMGYRAIRPIGGLYLSPGEFAVVSVPQSLVGLNYTIQVGGSSIDNFNKGTHRRMDRITTTYPIESADVYVANPLGGGLYIRIPYDTTAGVVDINVTGGVVLAPRIAMTSIEQTTEIEWNESRTAPAPWVNLESDAFLMTVPSIWVRNYDFAPMYALLKNYSDSLAAVSELIGIPMDKRNNYVSYHTADRHIRYGSNGIGYPKVNDLCPADANGPQLSGFWGGEGYANYWMVTNPFTDGAATFWHEFGHECLYGNSMYRGERESIVHVPYTFAKNEIYGESIDVAFSDSINTKQQCKGTNPSEGCYIYEQNMNRVPQMSVDDAAIDWMVRENFRNGGEMDYSDTETDEIKYQHRGHAKYADMARIHGWQFQKDFYLQESLDEESNVRSTPCPSLSGSDDRTFRFSLEAGIDWTPLIHFWGIHPVQEQALKDCITLNGISSSPAIRAQLEHYASIVPMNQSAFIDYFDATYPGKRDVDCGNINYGCGWYNDWYPKWNETLAVESVNAVENIITKYFGGSPTKSPTALPTKSPTSSPTPMPTVSPTSSQPTSKPTAGPTSSPLVPPTSSPTLCADIKSESWCLAKLERGQCAGSVSQCPKTCGGCGVVVTPPPTPSGTPPPTPSSTPPPTSQCSSSECCFYSPKSSCEGALDGNSCDWSKGNCVPVGGRRLRGSLTQETSINRELGIFGMSHIAEERANMNAALSLWKGKSPSHYEYVLEYNYFAPHEQLVFAYMIEYLYYPVLPCDGEIGIMPPPPYSTCEDYWDSVKTEMQQISFKLTYGWLGVIASTMIGNILIYYGIGTASEKMNKRVRDAAFSSLLRQEISYFDFHTVGSLTSRLADDAALIHSFSGQPLRQLVLSLSSVLVGVAVSFVFMWPFALVCLGTIPFMGFGAEMEMKMYMGEDETETKEEENGPGAIAIESLLNIRTVASLSLESVRMDDYTEALTKKDPQVLLTNVKKGSVVSLGQIIQMWGMALMFWWGGWLLWQYPEVFTYRDFLISMFSLLFSLSGLGMAAQGATNRDKASAAAGRIFDLIERESTIDPLSNEGYKPGTP